MFIFPFDSIAIGNQSIKDPTIGEVEMKTDNVEDDPNCNLKDTHSIVNRDNGKRRAVTLRGLGLTHPTLLSA